MSAVVLTDVTKGYRIRDTDLTVLRGLNFTLEAGAEAALVGASGSGKSTLLSLIAGLDKPTTGQVVTAGVDLVRAKARDLPAFRFQHIGFVFQQYHLIPTLTAMENVLLPCAPWRVNYRPKERAAELLHLVGLGDRLDHLPAQLSGGEQQRVCVARALINRPTLLLADEPTGNLDEASAGEVLGLIRELAAQFNMALLMVTHDMGLARSFSRVVRLSQRCLEPLPSP